MSENAVEQVSIGSNWLILIIVAVVLALWVVGWLGFILGLDVAEQRAARAATRVPCPTCGADPGEPCTHPTRRTGDTS
jgi:hypothetical protein